MFNESLYLCSTASVLQNLCLKFIAYSVTVASVRYVLSSMIVINAQRLLWVNDDFSVVMTINF